MKFRLVDKILHIWQGKSIETRKAISFEEFSLLKRWGRKGAFPETLILQFAIESASHLVAYSSNFTKVCFLAEVLVARFFRQTGPGAILLGNIEMAPLDETHFQCAFKIHSEGKIVAEGVFIVDIIPLHKCFNREHYILMWRGICDETPGA